MPTRTEFLSDRHGHLYRDVLDDPRVDFEVVLSFFDEPSTRERMDAAARAGRSPLAAVVADLESCPEVDAFFRGHDADTTTRFRQAVGVTVRMVMEQQGWSPTGQKGYLGRRAKVSAGTTVPGAHYNVSGHSRWFTRGEVYARRPPDSAASAARADRPRRTPGRSSRAVARRVREGLDRLERIGTESERRETFEYLMDALARTRAAEGRPF